MTGKPSRRREWLVVFTVLGAALVWYTARYLIPGPRPYAGPGKPGVDYFMVIRVPELPKDDVGIAGQTERVADWLDSTIASGFKPILLSDALARLKHGEPLPEKSLVFAFTHSYRPTVDTIKPLFESRGAPALWLSNRIGLETSDERFVSPHEWKLMRRSRQWDLGTYGGSSRTFVLDGRGAERPLSWDPDSGRFALNRASEMPKLRFLSVQLSWTGRQLLDRLYSELPLRERTRLTAVQMLKWQLGTPVYDAQSPGSFTVSAPPRRRSGAVRWLGAEWAPDGAMQVSAKELIGELWVGLRTLPDGSSLRVGFTEDRWVVELSFEGRDKRLLAVPWRYKKKRAIDAAIVWRGERLVVRTEGQSRELAVPRSAGWRGPMELVVYHKIRGVARAKEIAALLVPLPERESRPVRSSSAAGSP